MRYGYMVSVDILFWVDAKNQKEADKRASDVADSVTQGKCGQRATGLRRVVDVDFEDVPDTQIVAELPVSADKDTAPDV